MGQADGVFDVSFAAIECKRQRGIVNHEVTLCDGDFLVGSTFIGKRDGGRAVFGAFIGGAGEGHAFAADGEVADPFGFGGSIKARAGYGIVDGVCDFARGGIVGNVHVFGIDGGLWHAFLRYGNQIGRG